MTLGGRIARIALSTSLLWPASAHAEERTETPSSSPSPADIQEATRRFRSGEQMIANRDYAGAIGEFLRAYQLDPKPVHLYNLGIAYQRNEELDQAIDYYGRYLRAAPTGKQAADARQLLYKLQAEVAVAKAAQANAAAEQAQAEATAARAEAMLARTAAEAAQVRATTAELALLNAPKAEPVIVAATPPPSKGDRGVAADANAGQAWLMPTALTEPAGTWTFFDEELLLLGGSYAITDQVTARITTAIPGTLKSRLGSLAVKVQVARSNRVRIAAHGSLTYLRDGDSSLIMGGIGGALTLCIDRGCHSHLSGYAGVAVAREASTSIPFVAAASLSLRLTPHMKALFEADSAAIAGEIEGVSSGILGWYGLRFAWQRFGLDLGFGKPLSGDAADDTGVGLPFARITFRSYDE